MNKHRPFLSILLALLLLFAQASSLAHTIAHGCETVGNQQEQQLPHEQTCDQCHAYAEFGSSLVSNFSLPLPPVAIFTLTSDISVQTELPQRPTHFLSRAPPAA